jgi:hypothetical protein
MSEMLCEINIHRPIHLGERLGTVRVVLVRSLKFEIPKANGPAGGGLPLHATQRGSAARPCFQSAKPIQPAQD